VLSPEVYKKDLIIKWRPAEEKEIESFLAEKIIKREAREAKDAIISFHFICL